MDLLQISYNSQLDNEFKSLGFYNGMEIFDNAKPFGAFLISRTIVPVKAWALCYDRVEFFFMIAPPDRGCDDYVRAVRATTGRQCGFRDEEDQTTLWYSYLSNSIPTKNEIIARIELIERCKIQYAPAVLTSLLIHRKERQRDRFDKGQNKAPPF